MAHYWPPASMHAVAQRLADAVERVGVPPLLLDVEPTGLQRNCLSAALSGADALALPGRGLLNVPRLAPAPSGRVAAQLFYRRDA